MNGTQHFGEQRVKKNIETIERRRYLRLLDYFRVDLRPLALTPEEAASGVEQGFSKNLSLGGVCFVTRTESLPGELLEATIHIPELDNPLHVGGEVVRCRPHPGEKFEVAIRFLPASMDEKTREALEGFLYRQFI